MAKKIYAVKRGRILGIFDTWDDCQESVKGYSGAEFKSFKTREEAIAYLQDTPVTVEIVPPNTPPTAEIVSPETSSAVGIAYVDGSYNKDTQRVGSACVLTIGEESHTYTNSFYDEYGMRNVSGEIDAAEIAIRKAIEAGLTKIIIYHDYLGISAWANGDWKCNKTKTKEYAMTVEALRKDIEVEFHHVKGHSGVEGNELVDRLAKEAAGVV